MLVVGGGIAGAATAFRLAQAGVETVLLERFDLGTQASGANAGSMHGQIQFTPFRDFGWEWARRWAPTLRLLEASVEIWKGLDRELGVDVELRLGGGLLVASDERQLRLIERKVALENEHGVASQLLDRAALREVAPYVADEMVGGELCPIEGKANPLLATPAFAAAAERAGARIVRNADVTAIERTRDGFELATTRGRFRAPRLVLCAGAATAPLARMLGVELPIEGHPMQVNVTEAVAPLVPHLVYFAGDRLTLEAGARRLAADRRRLACGRPSRHRQADGRPARRPPQPRRRAPCRTGRGLGAAAADVGRRQQRRARRDADRRSARRGRARSRRRHLPVPRLLRRADHGRAAERPGAWARAALRPLPVSPVAV